MARIIDIEGVGEKYAEKLKAVGATTVENLLKMGASAKGRKELVEKTGIGEHLILKWVNYADLYRVKGVSTQYSQLLESAGVDSCTELAHRVPEHLVKKMAEVNAEKKLVRRIPVLSQVEKWVEQAKALPKLVTH